MPARYNPPPNWPPPPAGWTPPQGWTPDPAWGPAPQGWQLWVEDQGAPGAAYGVSPGGAAPAGASPIPRDNTTKRPWYKKKRFLIPIALLFIIIVWPKGGNDGQPPAAGPEVTREPADEGPADEEPAEEEPAEEEPVAPAVAELNTPVRDGNFEFTVTGVERVGTTIGEDFLQETAQGEFIIVRVNVTNIGDEAATLSSSGQVLYNEGGQQYEPSSAIFALPDADKFFLENINPGNTVTGAPLLFDVPPGTVLDRIELHDSFFSGGVDVSLAGL